MEKVLWFFLSRKNALSCYALQMAGGYRPVMIRSTSWLTDGTNPLE